MENIKFSEIEGSFDELPMQLQLELLSLAKKAILDEFNDLSRLIAGKLFIVSFMKIAFEDDELLTQHKLEKAWSLCNEAADFLVKKDAEAVEQVLMSL